jgi:hypothetical protein
MDKLIEHYRERLGYYAMNPKSLIGPGARLLHISNTTEEALNVAVFTMMPKNSEPPKYNHSSFLNLEDNIKNCIALIAYLKNGKRL